MTEKFDIKSILVAGLAYARKHPWLSLLFVVRSWVGLVLLVFTTLYIGFYESEKTSGQLSDDFLRLAEKQQPFLDASITLTGNLTSGEQDIDLSKDLSHLTDLARDVLAALGDLRAPSNPIDDARLDYKNAVEHLIGVLSRLQRGEVAGMGAVLHNSLQLTTNEANEFRTQVEDFQGGAWTRTWRSLL